jgi:hypothetical protein
MPSGECHVFRCPSSNTPGVTSFLRFAYSSTRAAKLAAKGVANEVPDFWGHADFMPAPMTLKFSLWLCAGGVVVSLFPKRISSTDTDNF